MAFGSFLLRCKARPARLLQRQALFGAGRRADAAADAGVGVEPPGLGRAVHRDGPLRAFFGAEGAVHTGVPRIDRPAARLARRGVGRFGAGESLAAFLGGGGGVAGHDGQHFLGADVDAVAALDAVEPVDGPGAGGAVHFERAGRAAARAQAAADTVLDLNFNMAAHALGVVRRLKRVAGGGRFGEEVFQHAARERERAPGVGFGVRVCVPSSLTSRYS